MLCLTGGSKLGKCKSPESDQNEGALAARYLSFQINE
jgi:hypothetical protein